MNEIDAYIKVLKDNRGDNVKDDKHTDIRRLFNLMVMCNKAYIYHGSDAGDYLVFHIHNKGWTSVHMTTTVRKGMEIITIDFHDHGPDTQYELEFREAHPAQVIKDDDRL